MYKEINLLPRKQYKLYKFIQIDKYCRCFNENYSKFYY